MHKFQSLPRLTKAAVLFGAAYAVLAFTALATGGESSPLLIPYVLASVFLLAWFFYLCGKG